MRNKINKILLLLGVLGMTSLGIFAQDDNPTLNYTNVEIQRVQKGKKLDIKYVIEKEKYFSRQQVIFLHAYLVSNDGTKEKLVDELQIIGKGREKSIRRNKVLKNDTGLPEMNNLRKVKELPLSFSIQIPFERWMVNAKLEIREAIYGCASCKVGEGVRNIFALNLPDFNKKDYKFSYIEPKGVEFKSYEEKFECRINFRVGRHELLPTFKNNASELSRLNSFVSKALHLQGATLDAVSILGFASPEGKFEANRSLAERRAKVLGAYVKGRHPGIKKCPSFIVKGIGEDWAGLRSSIEKSELEDKAELLAIIDRYSTDLEREKDMKALKGGRVYATLVKEFYPPLRRTTFSLGFAVRPFKVEELVDVYGKNPRLMSHRELYLLSGLLAKNKKENLDVFATAQELFASDPISRLNYANALLEKKQDAKKAIQVLEPIKHDKRALLPLAIAYDMLGDIDSKEAVILEGIEKGVFESGKYGL